MSNILILLMFPDSSCACAIIEHFWFKRSLITVDKIKTWENQVAKQHLGEEMPAAEVLRYKYK